MNLKNKKKLIARTLGVGIDRIVLDNTKLNDIKEIITRQDIRELVKERVIMIRGIKGRRKIEKRKTRKRGGKMRKVAKNKKREYARVTRKLRNHLLSMKTSGKIPKEHYHELRKKIRARFFKSLSHLKEHLRSKP